MQHPSRHFLVQHGDRNLAVMPRSPTASPSAMYKPPRACEDPSAYNGLDLCRAGVLNATCLELYHK